MIAEVQAQLRRELQRTNPDYVVYVPGHYDGSTDDGLNEHFLVFDGPDGSLMAVWTQSAMAAGRPGKRQVNRIVFSRSDDEGVTWTPPTHVAGPKGADDPAPMASWAFPLVSKSGRTHGVRARIYVVYNQNQGNAGWIMMHTGTMDAVYSDDNGATWSAPQNLPLPKSPFDDPEGAVPPEWIVWQQPMRDLSGGYFVGYSHWVNKAAATLKEVSGWTEIESVCEFMRFVNVDDDPEPKDLTVRYSAWGDKALRVPHWKHPLLSIAQEPSLVRLPDDRLFCVMRTCSGYIWWSQSADDGGTWCSPRPLLDRDFGKPLLNPVGCDPIYQLADGRYLLLYSNNRGDLASGGAADAGPRRPCYAALGEFRPAADQPVWFSPPKLLMDTDDCGVDGVKNTPETPRNSGLSMYASFTTRNGNNVLWYPDRKFFLLGKCITAEFLADMTVPQQTGAPADDRSSVPAGVSPPGPVSPTSRAPRTRMGASACRGGW